MGEEPHMLEHGKLDTKEVHQIGQSSKEMDVHWCRQRDIWLVIVRFPTELANLWFCLQLIFAGQSGCFGSTRQ